MLPLPAPVILVPFNVMVVWSSLSYWTLLSAAMELKPNTSAAATAIANTFLFVLFIIVSSRLYKKWTQKTSSECDHDFGYQTNIERLSHFLYSVVGATKRRLEPKAPDIQERNALNVRVI